MIFNLTTRQEYVLEHFREIFNDVFKVLLFVFLITLLVREFYPTFINSRININWFMFVVIVFGAISILFPPKYKEEKRREQKKLRLIDIIFIVAGGILGGVIIFLKLRDLGWIGYVISALGALIIIILSWLILTEKDEEENKL